MNVDHRHVCALHHAFKTVQGFSDTLSVRCITILTRVPFNGSSEKIGTKEIAEDTGIHSTNVSRILANLDGLGLVRRRPLGRDRRRIAVTRTVKGEELISAMKYSGDEDEIVQRISDDLDGL